MPVESKQNRRLAAIMFTDMVGYSALTQKNEALALDLLEESRRILRPVFKVHHGKEIETVGDAFFVEFPSALDGARCAVEIQQKLHERNATTSHGKEIRLRIGLHLGDVVQRGKHVHGDGVNIAARIEPLAPPGGICVSEDIARQIQNKIGLPLSVLGQGELKNIDLSVNIFRIILPWDTKTHFAQRLLFGKRKKRLYATAIGVAFVIAIVAFLFPFISPSRNANSIAVLPFRNMSDSPENEYFSDGITEDVIAQLSKIRHLRVISPTSMRRYKNTDKQAQEIGRELDVSTILDGSIRREGDTVRILARLIDAATDEHLWQEEYNQGLAHIFAIQLDVAKQIAHALKAIISPEEKDRLTSKRTENLDAYDLYLRGRYLWNKRYPPDTLKKSIEYFKQAIAADSSYALAYAGLADAYVVLGDFNIRPPRETYVLAKDAALKAMSIDDGLSEVHTSYAYALMHYDWDWGRAEEGFKRAIELNPSNARAHSWYGLLLTATGRFDEAVEEGKLALRLDPNSTAIRSDAGLTWYFSRRYDQAIDAFKGVLQLDPTFAPAYLPLGAAYEQKHILDSARMAFSAASLFTRGNPVAVAAMCHAFALSEMRGDAESMMELFEEKSQNEYVATYWKIVAHLGLGHSQRALELLEQAVTERDGLLVFLQVDPVFDSIRSHPRFIAVVEKMGFPRTQSLF
ncbi:MAG TPA: adenylate/guanylate cyclase domain-containing protein [Bacteroidota bacterium]|nr:adenylate/guanylate cyclase domain-containing protein [Bacteroidota bacterium]